MVRFSKKVGYPTFHSLLIQFLFKNSKMSSFLTYLLREKRQKKNPLKFSMKIFYTLGKFSARRTCTYFKYQLSAIVSVVSSTSSGKKNFLHTWKIFSQTYQHLLYVLVKCNCKCSVKYVQRKISGDFFSNFFPLRDRSKIMPFLNSLIKA